jgi:agmatinase
LPEEDLLFADADSIFEEAAFYLHGACFDRTSSHRKGSAAGPTAIREESYNFETFFPEHGIDLEDLKIYDAGDVSGDDQEKVLSEVEEKTAEALDRGCFPVLLGGEHSATLGAVRAFKKKHPDLFHVHIDAHLDYREEYEGNPLSHACVLKRVADLLGPKNIAAVGIRSYSREEAVRMKEDELLLFTNDDVHYEDYLEQVKGAIKDRPVYISLDMDAIDPSHAPGVGNPEPFGMEPVQVKELLHELRSVMVGFDLMEVNPHYDNGNTAALAARLIREVLALKGQS